MLVAEWQVNRFVIFPSLLISAESLDSRGYSLLKANPPLGRLWS